MSPKAKVAKKKAYELQNSKMHPHVKVWGKEIERRITTERRRAEKVLQARLHITDFAVAHPLSDLLQNALDELCKLTDSPIGFFHFVENDQRTISLQAWSTRTLEEFCSAEGQGRHYDIDRAGVWVECVREMRPIIHNDYASLPASRRKGLPAGHAPVIREMVFPITRNHKIVALIGVGNKPTDYTNDDLSYASHLADLIWDITERKRAEEALQQSEARYRSILEDQTELICRYLPDGRLSYVNEAYARYYGESAEKLINTNFIPQIPEPDLSILIQKIGGITPQDPVVVYEHRILKPDGEFCWQRWTHRGIYNNEGNLIEHQAVGRDITESVQAKDKIELLAKLPAEDPNPVLRVARDGSLLYINDAGLTLLPQWQLGVGEPIPDILLGTVAQSMNDATPRTIDIEHGARLYAFHVAPIVSAGYANVYGRDITESQQVKALRDAEARYHVLFDQSPYGVLLVDPETGHTIEANDITSRQLGYSREEFAGLKISDYEAAEVPEQIREHMQRVMSKGSDDFETLHRAKTGELRNVHVWVKRLKLDGRFFFYTIYQDITERKRMEETNEAYSREIALLEERQRIASDLHDSISQTLFSARLIAERLAHHPDRQSDAFARSLMDLNRLSRSAAGELRLILVELRRHALTNVSLNTLLANLIDSGMARTNANLIFECETEELDLPAPIKHAFYRIAQEAMNNSIKHGKPNNIRCILHGNEQGLEMIVGDDGIGFTVDNVLDDHFGLQIMRERAEQIGATLVFSSQPGIGTSITLTWKMGQS